MTKQYVKRQHSAATTEEYVFNQLIPYIGSKRKLLDLIDQAVSQLDLPRGSTALDLFAGSGVVSRYFKEKGFRVFSNDWEPYSYTINRCFVEQNVEPAFNAFGGFDRAVDILNNIEPIVGWVTTHLCPDDDENYDAERDRMFYTRSNGMMIDAMRDTIEEWHNTGKIDDVEKASLIALMLYSACYTSNTSGVFKGFHNGWGGQTGTALYRILSDFRIRKPSLFNNGLRNVACNIDAINVHEYAEENGLYFDLAYLDPPYNQHPYGSNYHVLNTITLWDSPKLTPKINGRNKAAIREDWQLSRRSRFNYKHEALDAFEDIIIDLPARYILTSYSTEGNIDLEKMLDVCINRGKTWVVFKEYKRYRVSSQRFSSKPMNVEFIIITDTTKRHDGVSAKAMKKDILDHERESNELHPELVVANQPRLL